MDSCAEVSHNKTSAINGTSMTSDNRIIIAGGGPIGYTAAYLLARRGIPCTLLEAGIPLALGSDGPLNPGLNLMFALLHPVRPDEALSREQAVEAYTRGSAYAEFAERDKGTIEVGKLADLAVLSQDIFTVAPDALPATKSVLTLVGGKIVHDGGITP